VLNQVRRHEDMRWRYSSTYSYPRHLMDVIGRLHVPAALPPGKELPLPTEHEAGSVPASVWTGCRREKHRYLTPAI